MIDTFFGWAIKPEIELTIIDKLMGSLFLGIFIILFGWVLDKIVERMNKHDD